MIPRPSINATAALGSIAIHYPGWGESGSDAMWRKGQLNKVREWCKIVRDTGVLVAVNSHRPEVFEEVESQDWDVDFYQTCLYKFGRTIDILDFPAMIAQRYGVHHVEIQHPHFRSTEPDYLAEFRNRLKEAKSQITQLVLEFDELNVSSPDPVLRVETIDLTKRWIDHAVSLGCPRVMVNGVGRNGIHRRQH